MYRVTVRKPNGTLRSFYETKKEAQKCLARMRKAYKKAGFFDTKKGSRGYAFLLGDNNEFVGISIAEIYDNEG